MTKIAISSYDAASLASARRAGESRKYIWNRIRQQFGIPSTIKLGMATDRTLFVAKSDPRQFLIAGSDGMYSHVGRDDGAPVADTPRSLSSLKDVLSQATGSSRFAMSSDDTPPVETGWAVVPKGDLLSLLHDNADMDDVVLPQGFPADTDQDVVFDTATGDLYFRTV